MKQNIKITLYKQNNFCTYIHTHYKNYKLPATDSTSFMYVLYRVVAETVVVNFSRDLQPFTTSTKSTRRATGIYIY